MDVPVKQKRIHVPLAPQPRRPDGRRLCGELRQTAENQHYRTPKSADAAAKSRVDDDQESPRSLRGYKGWFRQVTGFNVARGSKRTSALDQHIPR